MKKLLLIIIFIMTSFILAFIQTGCSKTLSIEEIKSCVEIVDLDTKWVKKHYQPWPPKLTLVPALSFKVKNISNEPLRYIYFNAIFKFKDDPENLGDNLQAGIGGKSLMPGEVSDAILMKCNFGVEGKRLSDFKNNPQWKPALVRLFIKLKGSQYVLLGEWDISRKIDFKEPEPVGMEKKEEKTSF